MPTTPLSYGMVGEADKFPCASAVNVPRGRSAGATPGELRGPCKTIAIDSPGFHPVPVMVSALFQVNGPPDTLSEAPSKAPKDAMERRIGMILKFMSCNRELLKPRDVNREF